MLLDYVADEIDLALVHPVKTCQKSGNMFSCGTNNLSIKLFNKLARNILLYLMRYSQVIN